MTVRADTAAQLTTDWADIPALAGLRVIATERPLDDVKVPTALIRWKTVTPFPQAPQAARNVGLLLVLISPHQNADDAADQLDGWTEAALDYLDTHIPHGDAEVTGWTGSRLAVEIPLTVTATKE